MHTHTNTQIQTHENTQIDIQPHRHWKKQGLTHIIFVKNITGPKFWGQQNYAKNVSWVEFIWRIKVQKYNSLGSKTTV